MYYSLLVFDEANFYVRLLLICSSQKMKSFRYHRMLYTFIFIIIRDVKDFELSFKALGLKF